VRDLLGLLSQTPETVIRQLPSAARDALALCDNANLSRSELADRLSVDPSLVQAVLRQANGAWFGAGLSAVLRVDSAIDRIGIAGTRAVIMSACVDGLLAKPGGVYDAMVADIWSHMVHTAPLARALAPAFGADPEEAFAVSMLHDVGKLVFFDQVSALRQLRRRPVNLPVPWLSRALEQLHEPIGASALHQWGLGPAAADAIGLHHRRERPSVRHPLAEVLFLAERADHARTDGVTLDYDGLWSLGELNGDELGCRGVLGRHLRVAA
jgi:HD-like signal output (HDOD) protein